MSELRLPRVNSITISGRLTRDCELKYTQGGTAVTSLSLAFDRAYKDSAGSWQQESSFIDVTLWDKKAEKAAQDFKKGSPVIVEGYLKTRAYVDKDNNNRKIVEIVAHKVHGLEKYQGNEEDTPY